jgi:hypothetical protein
MLKAVFGLLLTVAAFAADVPRTPPRFRVGACTHFSQDKGLLPANLSLARQAGIVSIRDEVGWRSIERTKGVYTMPESYEAYVNAAIAAGLETMLILDYGNPFYDNGDKPLSPEAVEGFVKYSEFIVRHFKGRVKLYEVWNEWDIGIGGTTPANALTYVNLLAKVYPRIKVIDPSIVVMGGAMTPGGLQRGWFEEMLKAGGLKYLDEVSIHTYNYSNSGRERTPEAFGEWMFKVDEMIRKYSGGTSYAVNVTEMGWPTQIDRRGTPPEVSASYLARMYLLARTMPFMRGIWWYDFQDDGWKHSYNEANFGIIRPDLTPKPGYFALKDIAALAGQSEYAGRVDVGDPDVWLLKFRGPGDQDTWAVWSSHEDDDWQITLESHRPEPQPLLLTLVGSGSMQRPWGARDWAGSRGAAIDKTHIELTVRGVPWLVTGDLDGVTVAGVKRRDFPEAQRFTQFLR